MARVVYASFATRRHSGGVHVISQHVMLLRAAGHDAWVWLPGPQRPGWFDPALPVVFGATTEIGADDLLVVPEVPVVPDRDPAPGARKVVFNQNHFYTFAAAASSLTPYPDWSPAPAVWTVSQESRAVLEALHPYLPVTVVPNPLDTDLFVTGTDRRPGVVWLPRKRPLEAALVHRLLREDARVAGVDLCAVVDVSLSAFAQRLGAATVFIALGHSEGFGLPVAEALAAGCLVVGYDGGGGRELFAAPGAWAVPEQRPLLLVERVVELLLRADELAHLGPANRAWVLARYGPAHTGPALAAAVTDALTRPGAAARATHPAAWLDALPATFTVSG